jgi:hypothetical protein
MSDRSDRSPERQTAAGSGSTGAATAGSLAAPTAGNTTSSPLIVTAPAKVAETAGAAAGSPNSQPDPDADCGKVTQMAEAQLSPADIVWIIDSSPSMVDELATIEQNITNFATTIGQAGIDHHVVMLAPADVAASTPLGADPAHYLFVPAPVDSHNALSLLLDLYPQYASFMRPSAALHFVLVSDDESLVSAEDFRTQMTQTAGKSFQFHAIASESVNGLGCVGACGIPLVCGAFAPGYQYYALADSTGGQKISICTADWSMVFGPLQQAVIASAPLPCEYAIPTPPPGSALDTNRVNVEVVASGAAATTLPRADAEQACGDKNAWFYDDPKSPTRIQMCPSACDAISGGGSVQIKLGCETVPLN